MYEQLKNNKKLNMEERILSEIADAMLGSDWPDDEIRAKKIKDLREGKYRNLMMAVSPK